MSAAYLWRAAQSAALALSPGPAEINLSHYTRTIEDVRALAAECGVPPRASLYLDSEPHVIEFVELIVHGVIIRMQASRPAVPGDEATVEYRCRITSEHVDISEEAARAAIVKAGGAK